MKGLLRTSIPILALLATPSSAEEWALIHGGSELEAFTDVVPAPDGGVFAVGTRAAIGATDSDLWIVRVGVLGDLAWERTIPGLDVAASPAACMDADGFLRVVSTTRACGPGDSDVWVLQVSQSGDLTSQRCYGTPGLEELGLDADARAGGGVMVAGAVVSPPTDSTCFMLDVRPDGSVQREWACGPGTDYFFTSSAVRECPDGGFVVAGDLDSTSSDESTLALAKTGPSGRNDWTGFYGWGLGGELTALDLTSDGGIVAAGNLRIVGPGSDSNGCVTRVDDSGRLLWQAFIDGGGDESLESVAVLRDGSIVAVGTAARPGELADGWLVHLDAAGAELWQGRFGTPTADSASAVTETTNGDVVIVGGTSGGPSGSRDGWLVRLAGGSPLAACAFAWQVTGTREAAPASGYSLQSGGPQSNSHDVVVAESGNPITPLQTTVADPCSELAPPREVSPPGAASPLAFAAKTVLTWEEAARSGSDVFNLFRGRLSSLRRGEYGACLEPNVPSPAAVDVELPGLDDGWFYLVGGRNVAGDGPLGRSSLGVERGSLDACP